MTGSRLLRKLFTYNSGASDTYTHTSAKRPVSFDDIPHEYKKCGRLSLCPTARITTPVALVLWTEQAWA